jgi:hypothetical protein
VNSKLKNSLIVLLALTTIGGGVLAWQQFRAVAALRSNRETNTTDRAALEKRLADAEHRAHDLANELAALKARSNGEENPDGPPAGANANDRRGPGRFGGGPAGFMALMDDPKIAKLVNSQEKMMLDGRYAALFKSLTQGAGATTMTPEQIDAFKNLLVEKQNSVRDVMMTARSQGVTDRSEIRQLVKDTQAEVDTQIQSTLGADGYDQYQQYEKTLPQRNVVNQLSQSLSYTSTPLNDSQAQQLIQVLADNASATSSDSPRRTVGFGGGPGGFGGNAPITDAAIAQAQGVLTPAQLQALTALQQQQQAQEELRKAARAAQQNSATQAPRAVPSSPAPTK